MLNLLIVESGIDSAALQNALQADGYLTLKIEYGPLFMTQVRDIRPDALLITVDRPADPLLADLAALSRQMPLPVIMFANDGSASAIAGAIQADVSAYEVGGVQLDRLHSTVQVALARFRHLQGLKQALQDAKIQLEDRKQIDKAKAILMNTRNFTENEAYHTLRKLAMDRNITLGQMARNVIAMAELLK